MIRVNPAAENYLHKDGQASLVVVRVNAHGNPDSVSYWKNPGRITKRNHEEDYTVGALVDIWV
jgi:hypothetical protein